jgi:hypothetical protein
LLRTLSVDASWWLGTARASVGERLPVECDRLLLCCFRFALGLLGGEEILLGLPQRGESLSNCLRCRDLRKVPCHRGRTGRSMGITILLSLFGIAAIRYRSRRSQSFTLLPR